MHPSVIDLHDLRYSNSMPDKSDSIADEADVYETFENSRDKVLLLRVRPSDPPYVLVEASLIFWGAMRSRSMSLDIK